MKAQGGGSIVFIGSKNGDCRGDQRVGLCLGQGGGAAPRALPGAGRRAVRHPRQHGQSGRGDQGLAHLGRRLAPANAPAHTASIRAASSRNIIATARCCKRDVLPEDVAEAVYFLSLRYASAKSTGNIDQRRRRATRRPLRDKIRNQESIWLATCRSRTGPDRAAECGAGRRARRRLWQPRPRSSAGAGSISMAVKAKVAGFSVAVPSWGAGRGGTRFAKFPIPGEPTNIHEKLEDCAVIQQLGRATPRVSPHFPWDKVGDYRGAARGGRGARPRLRRGQLATPSRTSRARRLSYRDRHAVLDRRCRGARAGGRA